MNCNDKGFTLIEVMIAIMVFSLGVLAMQAMQARSIDDNSLSSGISRKSSIALSQIEMIMNLPYDDPLLDDTDGDGTNPGQDNNLDGIDDHNDANASITGVNEDFGLRHWQCWENPATGLDEDAFGTAVAGCTHRADHAASFEGFAIYWNIAVDQPTENTKTINIIVIDNRDEFNPNRMAQNRAEYTYVKDDVI